MPQAEIDAVKPHVSRQIWALIQLQLLTGARSGELLALRPTDFQNMSGPVWLVALGEHKTAHHGKTRTLYFGPQAQEVLQPFLADRPTDKPLFSPAEAETDRRGPTNYNTKHPPGETYQPRSYRRAIWRACLRVHRYTDEMTKHERKEHRERVCWHPHQLRHNYGTMIRKTFSLEEAQNMLDHSSVEMTRVYTDRDRDQAVEIARQVG